MSSGKSTTATIILGLADSNTQPIRGDAGTDLFGGDCGRPDSPESCADVPPHTLADGDAAGWTAVIQQLVEQQLSTQIGSRSVSKSH